jgi:uncharacterized protein YaiL (DUF2058 family)
MSQSLQDQLKALGLAKEAAPGSSGKRRHAHGAKSRHGQQPKPGRGAGGTPPQGSKTREELSLEQAYRLREQESKSRAAAAKEKKRLEDLKRKQLNKQIKAIVDPHRLNDPAADLPRHFMYKGRIRKVNLTAAQLKSLNEGALGLVYLSGGYHVLPGEMVAQVSQLSEEHVPDLSGAPEEEEEFPVPDDLVW